MKLDRLTVSPEGHPLAEATTDDRGGGFLG
jgi:hypothetical protein